MVPVYFDSSAFVKLLVEEAHSGHLASQYALRGADAVHLASLLAVGAADTLFAVWDRARQSATHAAGVQVAPSR